MKKQLFGLAALVTMCSLLTGAAWAQTTYNGSDSNWDNDDWNVLANWDTGVPSGTIDAVIGAGETPSVKGAGATPAYDGTLTIGANASLWISGDEDLPALGTNVVMNAGSKLVLVNETYAFAKPITLVGAATLKLSESTAGHHTAKTFNAPINGAYELSLQGGNNNTYNFNVANAFSSLNFSSPANSRIYGNAAGSLGTGNVTIANSGSLMIYSTDAISDSGTLYLNGGRDTQLATTYDKLNMNVSDTITGLVVDGYPRPSGTYGRLGLGTVNYEVSWIKLNGILTVSSAPADSTPPTATFAGVGQGGGTTAVYVDEPVTYTITFNEPHTPLLKPADLENASTTPIQILSFTTNTLTGGMTVLSYTTVVKPTGPGTLQLRIKSGTVINDLFGNALVVPAPDNDTLTVKAWPLIKGELGVWKPWANGGINPVTAQPWKVGDTYRLAFTTSTKGNATSTDIATYNTFVQGVAAGSTAFPKLGNGTWKVLGSTAAVSAKDNTGTASGAGVAVLLMDGITVFATGNTDLWNGTAVRFTGIYMSPYFDQNGIDSGTDDQIYTGTNNDGTKHATQPFGASPVNTGKSRPNNSSRWMVQFNSAASASLRFYALSAPLTLLSNVPPGTVLMIK